MKKPNFYQALCVVIGALIGMHLANKIASGKAEDKSVTYTDISDAIKELDK